MSIPVPYSSMPAPSWRERVNLRVVTFVAVFALLLGFPLYTWLDASLTGGIKNHGDYVEADLKTLSSFPFNMQTGTISDVPPDFRALDGKTVVLVGEEAPGATEIEGVPRRFDLVYSVQKCCFSGTPQIQHFVHVTVPDGADVNLTRGGSIRIRGVLTVEVTRDPETNVVNGIYRVTATKLESVDA